MSASSTVCAEPRVFSPKCIKCRQKAMALATIPYETQIDHDGRKYLVSVPALVVPTCGNCGEVSFDDEANRQIDEAFRNTAGLMSPSQIRLGRERCGHTQQEFADVLGIAASTVSRWETGAQVQQRSLNRFMRAFFELDVLRHLLEQYESAARAGEKPSHPAEEQAAAAHAFAR